MIQESLIQEYCQPKKVIYFTFLSNPQIFRGPRFINGFLKGCNKSNASQDQEMFGISLTIIKLSNEVNVTRFKYVHIFIFSHLCVQISLLAKTFVFVTCNLDEYIYKIL